MAGNSERLHNRAKHNVGTWSRPRDMTAAQDDAQTAWRRDYFRDARPDLDPQSATSRVLEFFGMDTPYAQNDSSYDYRSKAWDDSVKSGNPDMSWSLPLADSFKFWGDEVDGPIPTQADASAALGRGATSDEIESARYALADTRTRDEKNAAAALNALNLPLVGLGDEAVAGAMSLAGRGSYDEELDRARQIREGSEDYGTDTGRMVTGAAGGLAGTFGSPLFSLPFAAAQKAWAGGRAALGLAPEAAGVLGKAAETVGPGAAGGAADFAMYNFNEGAGGAEKRFEGVTPEDVGSGALLGGVIGPLAFSAPRAIAKGAYNQSKRLGQAVAKRMARGETAQATARTPHDAPMPKPNRGASPRQAPQEPGDGSVRDAIKKAFRKGRRK